MEWTNTVMLGAPVHNARSRILGRFLGLLVLKDVSVMQVLSRGRAHHQVAMCPSLSVPVLASASTILSACGVFASLYWRQRVRARKRACLCDEVTDDRRVTRSTGTEH